jgi:uncharacterized protein (DUF433 family)
LLASGEDEQHILEEYPHLTHEDVIAALKYGANLVEEERVYPLEKLRYA